MKTYYEVHRSRTCKAVGKVEQYDTWDVENKNFPTIAEAKKFIKAEYGTCKREKMWYDGDGGEPKHIGYVYSYNTPKASYNDTAKNNKDWVEVREIKATTIII